MRLGPLILPTPIVRLKITLLLFASKPHHRGFKAPEHGSLSLTRREFFRKVVRGHNFRNRASNDVEFVPTSYPGVPFVFLLQRSMFMPLELGWSQKEDSLRLFFAQILEAESLVVHGKRTR